MKALNNFLMITITVVVFFFAGCGTTQQTINEICSATNGICTTVSTYCDQFGSYTPGVCEIAAQICDYSTAICVAVNGNDNLDEVHQQLLAVKEVLEHYKADNTESAKSAEYALNDALSQLKELYASLE